MVRAFIKNGGKLDAMGWSSYAGTSGGTYTTDQILDFVKTYHDEFKLETYMLEIGSTETPEKQQLNIEKWNASIEALNNPCEGGTFYWEPEGYTKLHWDPHIFNDAGKATSAWNAYKTPLKKSCTMTAVNQHDSFKYKDVNNRLCFINSLSKTISIRTEGQFNYSLYDLHGKILLSGKAQNAVDAGNKLKAGTYVVKIQTQQKNVMTKVSMY